jgi:DNA polymerase III delta prime subunit
MSQPILHPRTKLQIDTFLLRPSHALLLKGHTGIGKYYIASWLAQRLAKRVHVVKASEKKSVISIDQIRELYHITRTGDPVTIVIDDAHMLGLPAQNAFLKLLEEPPHDITFILTYACQGALLPTITSRCAVIDVLPPDKHMLLRSVPTDTNLAEPELQALLHTTQGLPARFFTALADTAINETHNQQIKEAKSFYAASKFERHLTLAGRNYEREWGLRLVEVLSIILETLLKQNAAAPNVIARLANQGALLENVTHALSSISGNPKIHLTQLAEEL